MPTNTYTPIGSVTLATATSEVTFTVPTGYRDLVLVVAAKNTGSGYDNIRVQFNGDTASNYSYVQVYFNGSSATSNSVTTTFFEGLTSANTHNAVNIMQVLDYSATDKHKTSLIRANTATAENGNRMAATRWASNSAINSIKLFNQSTNFDSGSTFNLYGIVA